MSGDAGLPAQRGAAGSAPRGRLAAGAERLEAAWRFAGLRGRRVLRRLTPHLLPYTLAERRRAAFRKIPEFQGPEWQPLEDAVMAHERQLAAAEVAGRFTGMLVSAYLLLPVGLLLLRMAPVAADLLTGSAFTTKPDLHVNTLVRSTFGFVVGLVAVTLVALRQGLRDESHRPPRVLRMAGTFFLLVTLGIIARLGIFPPRLDGRPSLTGVEWTALSYALMVLALYVIATLTRRVVRFNVRPTRRRVNEGAPCAVAVHELVNVLARTSDAGAARWTEVPRKRELMTSLGAVARAMHPHMGRYFRVGTDELDRWTAKRCAEMSAAVQEVAQLVFSAHEDAFAEFRQRCLRLLSAVSRGHWDDVPRAPAVDGPVESRISGAATLARRVAVVLAPALLVGGYGYLDAVVQAAGLKELPQLPEAAYVAVVLMTVTGLAGVLNPRVQADVTLAKSMMDLLSVGKR